jgi:malonyl-CoA decarboxylase
MPEEPIDSEQSKVTPAPPESRRTIGIQSLGRSLGSVLDVGRELLARKRVVRSVQVPEGSGAALVGACQDLLEHRGEPSGLALASEVVQAYRSLPETERFFFFASLAQEFSVDRERVLAAFEQYRQEDRVEHLWAVSRAVEAPRQKLFRRINMAPDGTRTLVELRGHLLPLLKAHPELKAIDVDLRQLFISWFNKGFLELRRIDWSSPASVLERIISYEAVHEINGWDDMQSRLGEDRRCFAFFHPALHDDPLVFVEIALTDSVPDSLPPLLVQERDRTIDKSTNTVVFYSISNCHAGLAGISFGNFLIKSVVEELQRELPRLKTFVTLSPVPGFRKWLMAARLQDYVPEALVDRVREPVGQVVDAQVYDALLKLCAHYLVEEKSAAMPLDPVARFHLGNGAQLYRINGAADLSAKGREQSAGIMVNYMYDLPNIEANHERFFDQGKIANARSVSRLLD